MNEKDIEIIRKGKDIYGNTVILYIEKGQLDLKRIKLEKEEDE